MAPIHTILHPTDFSDQAAYALHLASALARDYVARLVVLHVVVTPPAIYSEAVVVPPSREYLEEGKARLDQLVVPGENVRAERRLAEGDPVREILRVAGEIYADLIVMGTHGRTGLPRLLMGSVAEQVLREAPCPVLTVRTPLVEATAPLVVPAAV